MTASENVHYIRVQNREWALSAANSREDLMQWAKGMTTETGYIRAGS